MTEKKPAALVKVMRSGLGVDDMLMIDGHDNALIGVAVVWKEVASGGASRVDIAVNDGSKIVETLVKDGLDEDEASEFVQFNVEGAYVGITTPIIVWPCSRDYVDDLVSPPPEPLVPAPVKE